MHIGDAAHRSGITAKSIRHYESIGLLRPADRDANGYRRFSEVDVHELRFIKRARMLGFAIEQVRELLSLWRDHSRPSSKVRSLAQAHLQFLRKRIAATEEMAAALQRLVDACRGDNRPQCPILEDLGAE